MVGGSSTFSLGAGGGTISDTATVIAGSGYQSDTATLTGTAYDSYGDTASVSATDSANFTGETYGITIDKQISTDGVHWQDVGDGVLQDPTVAAGSSVYEQVILVNTGSVAITNASVSDVDGDGSRRLHLRRCQFDDTGGGSDPDLRHRDHHGPLRPLGRHGDGDRRGQRQLRRYSLG